METFLSRWKRSYHGGNVLTVVETISLQWKRSHCGGNDLTAVETKNKNLKTKKEVMALVDFCSFNMK